MSTLLQDLRYAFRTLRQNWALSGIAILSLALGIGANTAIFSLINAVLLRSLPVKDPEQLVMLTDPNSHGISIGATTGARSLLTYSEFTRIRERAHTVQGILAAQSSPDRVQMAIEGSAAKEPVRTEMVSGEYFNVLGVQPAIGRGFSAAEDRALDSSPFAVISYDFWKRRFGQDPGVLGKTMRVYRTAFTIVGVMPQGFFGENVGANPEVWLPLTMQHAVSPGREFLVQKPGSVEKVMWLQVMARLKPGIGMKQVQAEMDVLFSQMMAEDVVPGLGEDSVKQSKDQRIELTAGQMGASSVRRQFSEPLVVLFVIVGAVLLIACANVANLLLARGLARRKEISIRLAMGAARGRLIRQLVTESMLLAAIGGALGIVLAWWTDRLLLVMASRGDDPIALSVSPDGRLLLFTAAVSLLTGLLFGLLPAFRATRVDVAPVLKENSRGMTSVGLQGRGSRIPLGKVLVGVQVALSLMLLIGAGLFVKSLTNLGSVELGYDAERLLLVEVDPTPSGYKPAAIPQLYENILRRVRAIPGVRAASISENGLFRGGDSGDRISVEGYTSKNPRDLSARFDHAGPEYFKTVGIPVILGREFGPQDTRGTPRVCVINETMAKFYFGESSPLGKHIRDEFPGMEATFEIVGVVKDAKYGSVREKTPRRFYMPFYNGLGDPSSANVEVRTFADPRRVTSAIRRQLQEVDDSLDVGQVSVLRTLVDRTLTQDRMIARLAAAFGGLALLLASIGLYGVMAFTISRRTSEIGLRMALGAAQRSVMWMVVRDSMWMVLGGVVVGIPSAMALSRLVGNRLYGVKATDPVTMVGAAGVLLLIALVAVLVPAVRASRVDPTVALRCE